MSAGEEKLIIDPRTGKTVPASTCEAVKACHILLINGIDHQRQLAHLCFNMVQIGQGSAFPAYMQQLARSIYDINITKWTWEQVVRGEFQ